MDHMDGMKSLFDSFSILNFWDTANTKVIDPNSSWGKYKKDDVTDIDILLAPHHGRKTGGNSNYLDVLKPKLTLFGNAKSEYLNYNAWNSRNLDHITNNQANCIIMDTFGTNGIDIYVTYEAFAKKRNPKSTYNSTLKAWYIQTV